jgi:hypothetical protein
MMVGIVPVVDEVNLLGRQHFITILVSGLSPDNPEVKSKPS